MGTSDVYGRLVYYLNKKVSQRWPSRNGVLSAITFIGWSIDELEPVSVIGTAGRFLSGQGAV